MFRGLRQYLRILEVAGFPGFYIGAAFWAFIHCCLFGLKNIFASGAFNFYLTHGSSCETDGAIAPLPPLTIFADTGAQLTTCLQKRILL